VFRLKMRGIAGIPLLALKDCGRLWNPSGWSKSGCPGYETSNLAATCNLLIVGGDERNAMVP
jgi:hypothetical protein